ncbi:putative UPF0481 protein [Tanacetum coccineum]
MRSPRNRASTFWDLDRDNDALARLFAIDGLFLLHLLDAYMNRGQAIEAKDLFMLENQIPLIVLKEIQKTLLVDNAHLREAHLEFMFQDICKSHSPFHISKEEVGFNEVNHLLDYMYRSILQNKKLISNEIDIESPGSGSPQKNPLQELIEAIMKAVEKIPLAEPFVNVINMVLNKIFESMNKDIPMAEEIDVPSVSELHNIAKVKFLLSEQNEGIKNINFVPKERVCYLPRITFNYDSEVILRNLMAYENLMATNSFMSGIGLELTEYVDFMCGIIDTAKDVRLLRKEKIIEGDLDDEEIVKMFNGMGRSLAKMCVKSDLRTCIAELNKLYESMPIVWAKKMAENQIRGAAKAITFLVSISSTLILVHQVYSKAFPSNPPHTMIVHFLSELVKKCLSLIK